MINFLQKTSWTFSTMPQSYGFLHILFSVIGVLMVIFLSVFIRKSNNKTYSIIILCLGIFMILSEIYKLLFRYYITYNQDIQSWIWLFPFQLCSVPMYICLFMPFIKESKFKDGLYSFLAFYILPTSLIALIEPSGLLHQEITLFVHSFLWHIITLFVGFYTLLNKKMGSSLKQFLRGTVVFFVTVIIATIINLSLNDVGPITMFYINPHIISPLTVFNTIQIKYGYTVNLILYLSTIVLLAFITFLIPYFIRKKMDKKNKT